MQASYIVIIRNAILNLHSVTCTRLARNGAGRLRNHRSFETPSPQLPVVALSAVRDGNYMYTYNNGVDIAKNFLNASILQYPSSDSGYPIDVDFG